MKKLSREFYNRSSIEVAKDLLGKHLVHRADNIELIGKIVEVEAYMGTIDKAAHSYNNKRTKRTEIMFGPPGHAYVFLIYGMYSCMNVVTEGIGIPQAVLIRALEPISGLEKMAELRYSKSLDCCSKTELLGLTNGPGKLCKGLNIVKNNSGDDLCGNSLYICEGIENNTFDIITTPRINIDYAEEAIAFPWRFYIKENKYISSK